MLELRRWLAEDSRHQAAFAHEKANWRQMGPARERLRRHSGCHSPACCRPARRARSTGRGSAPPPGSPAGYLQRALYWSALFGQPA